MKNDRCGQAAILSLQQWNKLRRNVTNPKYRLLFAIAWFTGERWGAILQLRVVDVYSDPMNRVPKDEITFLAATRKGDKNGRRKTRQVPIEERLATELRAFSPSPTTGYLFPGQKPGSCLTFQAASQYLQRVLTRSGLQGLGFSTHSTRRSFITHLHREGGDDEEIKNLTGHKDWNSFRRYIQSDPDRKKKTLSLLPG